MGPAALTCFGDARAAAHYGGEVFACVGGGTHGGRYEPIRESAHRTVIEIHIAEGNSACAIKHYQRYQSLLQRELRVLPSQRMDRLVRTLGSG